VHSLTPITSLGGQTPQVDIFPTAICTEITDLALASVSARVGSEAACLKHMKALLKAEAPGPGKSQMGKMETAVWIGPDAWMIGAPFQTHEDIADQLKTRFKKTASVVEQTDAWCGFDLTGDALAPVMELLCNINMRTLQPGDAHRTTIHHLGCFVICGAPDSFIRILGPRASAGSLHHAITTAMKSAL
jgi:sarcosine oxidase subunit gamma